MSSKFITCIIVLLVLSLVVIPSPSFAADSDYLTPSEYTFTMRIASQISRARTVLDTYDRLTGDFRRFWEIANTRELRRILIRSTSFDGCLLPASAPDTMADIADLWNTEVCSDFGYISSEVATFVEPHSSPFDFMAGVVLIRLRVGRLRSTISKIEGMVADRVNELVEARQAEEEAKKELGNDSCFIATAAYGTPTAKEIDELRRFRDDYLRKSYLGNEFINFYYHNSPPVARFISEHEILRIMVRDGFVEPAVIAVKLTENLWAGN